LPYKTSEGEQNGAVGRLEDLVGAKKDHILASGENSTAQKYCLNFEPEKTALVRERRWVGHRRG